MDYLFIIEHSEKHLNHISNVRGKEGVSLHS